MANLAPEHDRNHSDQASELETHGDPLKISVHRDKHFATMSSHWAQIDSRRAPCGQAKGQPFGHSTRKSP
jgi:hypothetical protein